MGFKICKREFSCYSKEDKKARKVIKKVLKLTKITSSVLELSWLVEA